MTEVSVVFPSGGEIDVQNRESVEANQEVGWRVQSFNPNVSGVKITFKNAGNTFFGSSHESPVRPLSYSGVEGQQFATATIYGRAPEVTSEINMAEYTVTGVSSEGDIVLDPVIVIHPEPTGDTSSVSVNP